MTKNSIALIGFMGTGKTTIGEALVAYLGEDYKFIETDQEIIQEIGKPIPEIFAEDGEETFREYETSVCERVSKLKKVIVSCGGGVVLHHKNIENFKKNFHIILLNASQEEIYERILKNGKEKRPIIDKENLREKIVNILKYREVYYTAAAEIIIETTDKPIEEIVREIAIKTQLKT
jgi:shikimate kinase